MRGARATALRAFHDPRPHHRSPCQAARPPGLWRHRYGGGAAARRRGRRRARAAARLRRRHGRPDRLRPCRGVRDRPRLPRRAHDAGLRDPRKSRPARQPRGGAARTQHRYICPRPGSCITSSRTSRCGSSRSTRWCRARAAARSAPSERPGSPIACTKARGRPTLLLMHHPPFLTGVSGMDELICRTSPRFRGADPAPSRDRADPLRPLPPADPGPLRRHDRLRRAGHGASGRARSAARRAEPLHSGAARLCCARLDRRETGVVSHTSRSAISALAREFVLDAEYPGQARRDRPAAPPRRCGRAIARARGALLVAHAAAGHWRHAQRASATSSPPRTSPPRSSSSTGLRALTPDAAILSEEAGASGPCERARWIVDPLDGTVNYAAGLPWFSVTLAYQESGRTRLGITHAPAAA